MYIHGQFLVGKCVHVHKRITYCTRLHTWCFILHVPHCLRQDTEAGSLIQHVYNYSTCLHVKHVHVHVHVLYMCRTCVQVSIVALGPNVYTCIDAHK